MNPFVLRLIGSAVRWVLTAAGAASYFSDNEIAQIVGGIVTLGTLAWSAWEKYRSQKVTNVALAMPKGATLTEAKEAAGTAAAPPVSLPANAVPHMKAAR